MHRDKRRIVSRGFFLFFLPQAIMLECLWRRRRRRRSCKIGYNSFQFDSIRILDRGGNEQKLNWICTEWNGMQFRMQGEIRGYGTSIYRSFYRGIFFICILFISRGSDSVVVSEFPLTDSNPTKPGPVLSCPVLS